MIQGLKTLDLNKLECHTKAFKDETGCFSFFFIYEKVIVIYILAKP
jgi:hypothetical protein